MKPHRSILAFVALSCTLSSCIVQQIAGNFTRDVYPGTRPPHVIADVDGKPASQSWIQVKDTDLPPAGAVARTIRTAPDGLPYGLPCEFSDIIVSPYAPHYQLDYSSSQVGEKVWDPYTRKPFYIPRLYTFN